MKLIDAAKVEALVAKWRGLIKSPFRADLANAVRVHDVIDELSALLADAVEAEEEWGSAHKKFTDGREDYVIDHKGMTEAVAKKEAADGQAFGLNRNGEGKWWWPIRRLVTKWEAV